MIQSRKIFESDLQMLHSTLFDQLNAAVVFDPKQLVTKNVQGDLIFIETEDDLALVAKTAEEILLIVMSEDKPKTDISHFGAIISLHGLRLKSFAELPLYYLIGHFNTIRFAFPKTLKKPLFYQIKGEKFEYPLYKQIADKLFMQIGLHTFVAAPKLFLYHKNQELLSPENPFFIYAEHYVFNKKAHFFDVQNNEIKQLTKHSDSEYARELLDTETRVLRGIFPLLKKEKLQVPQVLHYGNTLTLSNNYPNGAEMTDQLEDLHLQALEELYETGLVQKTLGSFLIENNYLNLIKAFKLILTEGLHPNGISRQHVENISIDLITLMNRMNPNELINTSLYHGSFMAENCLKKDDVLYLNNFDKSQAEMPLLFDAFYYIFHEIEKDAMPQMGAFDDVMKHLFRNKTMLKLIEKQHINFKLHLALFHIHHSCTQIESFMKQRFINPNVNFTLTFYTQALERMNSLSF